MVANLEYETWFAASAESLVRAGFLRLRDGESLPERPEAQRMRKAWIEGRYVRDGLSYKPARDQHPMTRAMDLKACRDASPSFDKFCRELEKRSALAGA